jgi:hypothetical protein
MASYGRDGTCRAKASGFPEKTAQGEASRSALRWDHNQSWN